MKLLNIAYPKKSEVRSINLVWLGFILYSISYIATIPTQNNIKIFQGIQILGLLIFIAALVSVLNISIENKYLKLILPIYFAWLLIVVLRGLSYDYDFVKKFFLDPFGGGLIYFVPLIVFLPAIIYNVKNIFTAITILNITFLIFTIIYYARLADVGEDGKGLIEYFYKTISVPCGFLLFTYMYQSNFKKIVAILTLILSLYFAIKQARRGLIFISATTMLMFIILIIRKNINNFKNILLIVGSIFLATIIVLSTVSFESKFFDKIKDRKNEDTRGELELYFYDDMTDSDWLIGKGMSGLTPTPNLDLEENNVKGKAGYRDGIETDYLNIILKGGIVSLILLLVIVIPAIIKGFFYSKNSLSRGAASWIFLWVIYLYPTAVTTFTLHFVLVWLCVALCYSKETRMVPDEYLKEYF